MNRLWRTVLIVGGILVVAAVAVTIYAARSPARLPEQFTDVARPPAMFPDYTDCIVPPNLAPLNFLVEESGPRVRARIHADSGEEIVVGGRSGRIDIPVDRWRELLAANVGGSVHFDVFAHDAESDWQRFETFSVQIAEEPIDPYVVYRLLEYFLDF